MSHQLDVRLANVDKAMKQLRTAITGIPVRRAQFKKFHDAFARSVATLTVSTSYARNQLPR
ncbi:hypothetical protein M8C13_18065 [Crossiella sp. SN42]|uniref:hypothetical protein n=1 Tax=Crossiella sp. SN42 TaxID=2944808 RepID=UPI00207C9F2A|nr:hypothetical protein [Crossiella sp. SN42]MCO1577665.1 hypothetical protein [Crossiella sp. SN42]